MSAELKLFSSSSFSDDELDFDDLELADPKDGASVLTAASVVEVSRPARLLDRFSNSWEATSKKTAAYHKVVDPDKLRSVARALFN